jgi:hypothetical protein
MQKRNLRVLKWLGTIPATAVCTSCNREFEVSRIDMKGVADAQESLRVQFAEHECKDKNAHAAVREPAS